MQHHLISVFTHLDFHKLIGIALVDVNVFPKVLLQGLELELM